MSDPKGPFQIDRQPVEAISQAQAFVDDVEARIDDDDGEECYRLLVNLLSTASYLQGRVRELVRWHDIYAEELNRRHDPAPVGVRETAPGVWIRDDGKRPTFSPTYRYEEDPDMRFHDDWGWQHKDVLTEILELANPQPGAVVGGLSQIISEMRNFAYAAGPTEVANVIPAIRAWAFRLEELGANDKTTKGPQE